MDKGMTGPYKDQKNKLIRERTIAALEDLGRIMRDFPMDQLEQIFSETEKDEKIAVTLVKALLGFARHEKQEEQWNRDRDLKVESALQSPSPPREPLLPFHYEIAQTCVDFGTHRLLDKVESPYHDLVRKEINSLIPVLMHLRTT